MSIYYKGGHLHLPASWVKTWRAARLVAAWMKACEEAEVKL